MYLQKYLKYKQKYLNLLYGGSRKRLLPADQRVAKQLFLRNKFEDNQQKINTHIRERVNLINTFLKVCEQVYIKKYNNQQIDDKITKEQYVKKKYNQLFNQENLKNYKDIFSFNVFIQKIINKTCIEFEIKIKSNNDDDGVFDDEYGVFSSSSLEDYRKKARDKKFIDYMYVFNPIIPDENTIITNEIIFGGNILINYSFGILQTLNEQKTLIYYGLGTPDIKKIILNLFSYINKSLINSLNELFCNLSNQHNNLQPSNVDVYLLDYLSPYLYILREYNTPTRWTKCITFLKDIIKVDDLRKTNDLSTHSSSDIINIDLNERSRIIAQKVKNIIQQKSIPTLEITSKPTLRIMDGHGRIIYRCLQKLQNKIESGQFNLQVVDIDKWTDQWHKVTLPSINIDGKSDTTLKGDILPFINNENLANDVIYINFCGVGDSLTELIDNINSLDKHSYTNLIISFSVARAAQESTSDLRKLLNEKGFIQMTIIEKDKQTGEDVDITRNEFYTYYHA